MASKSNSLDSNTVCSDYSPLNEGSIETNNGTKHVQPLTSKSKCAIAAFVVGGVAGVVIVILGTTNLFGPVGSIGFIASIAGGGTVAVIATGGVIWIAISNCKRSNDATIHTLDDTGVSGSSVGTKKETEAKKETSGVSGAVSDKSYPEIGTQAIEFARQKLREYPKIEPYAFDWGEVQGTCQPVTQEIDLLTTLFWKESFEAFVQTVKKHRDDPWAHDEVIQAADTCVKISYAVGCLTLENLPDFTKKLAQKGDQRTYVQAQQDSYLYHTLCWCATPYHWMRGGIVWRTNPWNKNEEGLFHRQEEVSEEHAKPFYQEGTTQFSWRTLYNDYCDRIRIYVDESKLKAADKRYVKWTIKDEGSETFERDPDMPT
jgi:hypothetical protein